MRAGVVTFVVLFWAGVCSAQSPTDTKKALKHFEQAEAYMRVQAFDRAVVEYQAAYEIVPKPGFLFNIALAHDLGEHPKQIGCSG